MSQCVNNSRDRNMPSREGLLSPRRSSKLLPKCSRDLGHLKTNRFHRWNPEWPVQLTHGVKFFTTVEKYVKIWLDFRIFYYFLLFIIITIFCCVWKNPSKTTADIERINGAMKTGFFLLVAPVYPLHADINCGVWKCFNSTNTSTPILYLAKKRFFRNG